MKITLERVGLHDALFKLIIPYDCYTGHLVVSWSAGGVEGDAADVEHFVRRGLQRLVGRARPRQHVEIGRRQLDGILLSTY